MSIKGIVPYSDNAETLGRPEVHDSEGNIVQDKRYYKTVYANDIVSPRIDQMNAAIGNKAENSKVDEYVGMIGGANAPCYYERDTRFLVSEKTKIKTSEELWININKKGLKLNGQIIININNDASWDTDAKEWQANHVYVENDVVYPTNKQGYLYRCRTGGTSSTLTPTFPTELGQTYNDGSVVWQCQLDFTKAINRAGKDFYIYACTPSSGSSPDILISDNSTIPLWYQAANSRKIGGFHTLCADVGAIEGHTLSGYVKGDIIPNSVWDLKHRPKSDPEGMAYIEGIDLWVDIYLTSWTGSYSNTPENLKLVSRYGAVTADGTSSPEKFHWFKLSQLFSRQKKRMLWQHEFIAASIGSNQGTNVVGGKDVNTTGGFSDTAGRRMISNFGLEDCCGNLWQWGMDSGTGGSSYTSAFDVNDKYVAGQYTGVNKVVLGGAATHGAVCGSRASIWGNGPLTLSWDCGSRGASEPLHGA